jgi:protein-S-isoprenylcysteine O-methyltransferase Ste14
MSKLLVFLQFGFIGLIAYPSRAPVLELFSVTLFIAGLAVFFAAFLTMKSKNFTVMPEPRAGSALVTNGIYSLVRHPMYLAVLLCAAGASLAYGLLWKWCLSIALLAVLLVKLRREEKMLLQKYDDYAAYRDRTKAIVPFVL